MKSTLTILALSAVAANAATIVDFDFAGVDGTTAADKDKATFELTATDAISSGVSIVDGLNLRSPSTVDFTGGGTTSSTNDLNVNGWGAGGSFSAAFAGNRYITFTIQADTGFQLNLDGAAVTFTGFRNGSGAPSEFGITATTGGDTVVIGDQIGSDITVPNTGPGNVTPITASFSGSEWDGVTDQIEIRLYGAGSSTSGNMHFSNLVVDNGTVTAIPEPSSTALLGLAGLTLLTRRKR